MFCEVVMIDFKNLDEMLKMVSELDNDNVKYLDMLNKTIFKVFKRSDIVREGTVSDIDYGDWLLENSKITKESYINKIKKIEKVVN